MIGCGKLGQDCAEVMAQQYMVEGYDVEPRTPENFQMKGSIAEAVKDKDIVFIAAPTPHDPRYDGSTPTAHLEPKDFDYSQDEEWQRLKKESVKAYKALKEHEYNLRNK